jgi:DNA-binding transcriptional LysR family regulator
MAMTTKRMSRDYRQINLFMLVSLSALVKEKSVTAAARRLGISQPALSQILGKLRRLSADPIVVHGANAMIPTVRGLQLAELAERTIETFDASFWQSSKFDPAESSKLFSIMTSDYVQMVLFPALLKRTFAQSPRSSIRIVSTDLGRLYSDLENGAIDFGIGLYADLPPSLRSVGLFRDRLCCAVPRNRFSRKKRLSLSEYVSMDHVVYFAEEAGSSTLERHTDHALSLRGGERRIATHVQNLTTMLKYVGTQGLIATLPARFAETNHPNVMFLDAPFLIPEVVISMAWHERNHREPSLLWLRAIARDAARSLPPI